MTDMNTGKTLLVLAIVLGCFAVLWPKIFSPMMFENYNKIKPGETLCKFCILAYDPLKRFEGSKHSCTKLEGPFYSLEVYYLLYYIINIHAYYSEIV